MNVAISYSICSLLAIFSAYSIYANMNELSPLLLEEA